MGRDTLPTLILAPIRGITDVVYRDVFTSCFGGFDRAIAPFVKLRNGHALKPGERAQLEPGNNQALRTVPQVHTNHGPAFLAGLRELHELGHDEVNWNLGCPYPMVAKRRRGAGLLPHPDRIAAILDQVIGASPVRISAKIRLGYHDPDEFIAVINVLNRYPLTEVILHSRIATQLYDGAVDLARAAQAAELCGHPFVYNGDITSPEKLGEVRARIPGAAGWMIGRAALTNPFLPAQLKGARWPGGAERRDRLRDFHSRLFEGYRHRLSGPGHLIRKMQEHWRYLAAQFADPKRVFRQFRHCRDLNAYEGAAEVVLRLPLR